VGLTNGSWKFVEFLKLGGGAPCATLLRGVRQQKGRPGRAGAGTGRRACALVLLSQPRAALEIRIRDFMPGGTHGPSAGKGIGRRVLGSGLSPYRAAFLAPVPPHPRRGAASSCQPKRGGGPDDLETWPVVGQMAASRKAACNEAYATEAKKPNKRHGTGLRSFTASRILEVVCKKPRGIDWAGVPAHTHQRHCHFSKNDGGGKVHRGPHLPTERGGKTGGGPTFRGKKK